MQLAVVERRAQPRVERRPPVDPLLGGVLMVEVPRIGKRWWLITANNRIRTSVRADALRGVLAWPMAELYPMPVGDLMARIVGDVEVLGVGIREFTIETWDTLLFSVSLVVAMLLYDAPLTLLALAPVPLAMLLATMVRDTRAEDEQLPWSLRKVIAFGLALFGMVLGLDFLATRFLPASAWEAIARGLPLGPAQLKTLLCFGIPGCLILSQLERRAAFSMGLAAILMVSVWKKTTDDQVLDRGRNFYGTIATAKENLAGGEVLRMFHGNTIHGWHA